MGFLHSKSASPVTDKEDAEALFDKIYPDLSKALDTVKKSSGYKYKSWSGSFKSKDDRSLFGKTHYTVAVLPTGVGLWLRNYPRGPLLKLYMQQAYDAQQYQVFSVPLMSLLSAGSQYSYHIEIIPTHS